MTRKLFTFNPSSHAAQNLAGLKEAIQGPPGYPFVELKECGGHLEVTSDLCNLGAITCLLYTFGYYLAKTQEAVPETVPT